jgi:hypothetical protein
MENIKATVEKKCAEKAQSILLNRKIVEVRYLTDDEQNSLGWYAKSILLKLDDGTLVYPSMDDEGNNAGALFYQKEESDDYVIPVINL